MGTALAGAVAAHSLTYLVEVPDPHERARVLAATGHSYWGLAVGLAVALGLGSAVVVFARYFRAGAVRAALRSEDVATLWLRIAVVQVMAFAIAENAERLAVHAPPSTLSTHHLFSVGLLLQLVVAFVGALVLWLFARAGRFFGALLAPRLRARATHQAPTSHFLSVHPRWLLTAHPTRGPPAYSS